MRDVRDTETTVQSDDGRVEQPVVSGVTIPIDVLLAMGTGTTQGSFVASFEMSPAEEEAAVALAREQLPHLQAECDPSDDIVGGWRRVRGKKGSRVKMWEKGSPSSLTLSDANGKTKNNRKKSTSLPVPLTTHQRHRTTTSEVSHYAGTTTAVDAPTSDGAVRETYAVRSSITVQAPLASVMKTLDCSMATSYRSFTKIIYENLVADTSVLTHRRLALTDPEQPHLAESLAVRWLVCKCANPLVSDSDLCLVEYTKVHSIDELSAAGAAPNNQTPDAEENVAPAGENDGLRVSEKMPIAYKILRSMDTKHCPQLNDAPHHLERVQAPLGGFLLYATDNDEVTDVVFFMSVSYDRKKQYGLKPAQFLSSDDRQFRAIQGVLHQMALGIGRIANAVDAYAMSLQLETLRSTRWIENADRSECVVCYRRFHPITRRRHHCRLCGDIICRDCSIHKDADLPTIGPTTLRICKLCNVQHFGRSSALALIATDVKLTASALQGRERELDATSFESPAARRQRRQTTLSIDTTKRVTSGVQESPTAGVAGGIVGGGRRHSAEPPVSCPKPSEERRTERPSELPLSPPSSISPGKWSKAFYANRAATGSTSPFSTTSPLPRHTAGQAAPRLTQLYSPQAKFARTMPLPRSVSKEVQQPQPRSQRFSFGIMKGATQSPQTRPRQQSSGEAREPSRDDWKRSSVRLPQKSSLASPKPRKLSASSSENQAQDRERSASQSGPISLGRRAKLEHIAQFEDLLRDLCERASNATGAKFAAVSVFVPRGSTSGPSEPGGHAMAHYLKTKDSPKLMKIASNMRCCEPVLHLLRPVVTRNALAFSMGGYELASLPFVKGPHQARYYAGAPLVDSKNRLLGAVAVFDAKFVDDEDELLDSVNALEAIGQATITRIESRQADTALKTFMNNPLLRQTEPVMIMRDGDEDFDHNDDDEDDVDIYDEEDEERMRTFSRRSAVPFPSKSMQPLSSSASASASPAKKGEALEFYKRQMHRLVQQANQTQDQVMQNAMKMQGVSY